MYSSETNRSFTTKAKTEEHMQFEKPHQGWYFNEKLLFVSHLT